MLRENISYLGKFLLINEKYQSLLCCLCEDMTKLPDLLNEIIANCGVYFLEDNSDWRLATIRTLCEGKFRKEI